MGLKSSGIQSYLYFTIGNNMNIEIKKLKFGLVGREGTKSYQCELHVNGKHVADCREDGNGGGLIIRPINRTDYESIKNDVIDHIKNLASYNQRRDAFHKLYDFKDDGDHSDAIEEYVENFVEEAETRKYVERNQKNSILVMKDNEVLKVPFKQWTIEKLLNSQQGEDVIVKALRRDIGEGYKILNTNLTSLKSKYPEFEKELI